MLKTIILARTNWDSTTVNQRVTEALSNAGGLTATAAVTELDAKDDEPLVVKVLSSSSDMIKEGYIKIPE